MKKGFTLIEILVVIAILGIIIGVFFPNLNEFRRRARDQRRKADIKAIVEALEMYKQNQAPETYPPDLLITPGEIWEDVRATYIKSFPRDPLFNAKSEEYYYRYVLIDTLEYYVGACLEDETDPDGKAPPDPVFDSGHCDSNNWDYKSEP